MIWQLRFFIFKITTPIFLLLFSVQSVLANLLINKSQCYELFEDKNSILLVHNKIHSIELEIKRLISQYINKLGMYHDPFAITFTQSQADAIFKRLLSSYIIESDGNRFYPLAMIHDHLSQSYIKSNDFFNIGLVNKIQTTAVHILKQSNATDILISNTNKVKMQSLLLTLQTTLRYISRYKVDEHHNIANGNQIKQAQDNLIQDNSLKKQHIAQEYPDLPKVYTPSTKDSSKSSSNQTQIRIAETNARTSYFAQRYFSKIDRRSAYPFQTITLPITIADIPSSNGKYEKYLLIKTLGRKEVSLFVPSLFKPLQPLDPRAKIFKEEQGEGYILQITTNNISDIKKVIIPLMDDANIIMTQPLLDIYTQSVGFENSEWPSQIQRIITRITPSEGKKDALHTAKVVSAHIANDYLYSVGSRQELDPIDALKAGAFQCDMAAYIMVGILRDVYKIPSRVIGGFRAKQYQNGKDGKSYLVLPNEGHAWIEVFANGRWHIFDPTPIAKDRENQQQNQTQDKDEYSDIPMDENNSPNSPQQEKHHSDQKKSKSASASASSDDKSKQEAQEQALLDEDQLTNEDIADRLIIGSIEIGPQKDRNALFDRLMRFIFRQILDPTQSSHEIQNSIYATSSLNIFRFPELERLRTIALNVHSSDHPGLKKWIEQLIYMMPKQDINKSYQQLHNIRQAIEIYTSVLDRDGKIYRPDHLVSVLKQIQDYFNTLAHPASKDISLVSKVVQKLPLVAQIMLRNDFNFSSIGPNIPTQTIAEQIRQKKMDQLLLLVNLIDHTDFILNATPKPGGQLIKQWIKDPKQKKKPDILPVQNLRDLFNGGQIFGGEPGRTPLYNFFRDKRLYKYNKRRVINDPSHGFTNEESERITIVLYDTSDSMSGDPGRFQNGLIAAFTAKALSDLSPSGRHRHRLVLVPFDDNVGTPIQVNNTKEALNIITDYHNKLKNTRGGTNIQDAIMQGMALIADAQKRSGEPLSAANIILMSDGESNINAPELMKARQAIDRNTPLQCMFIAINGSNADLMKFAMQSDSIGIDRGFYREFTLQTIEEILRKSNDVKQLEKETTMFYSDKQSNVVPQNIYQMLKNALNLALVFENHINDGNQCKSIKDILHDLELLKSQNIDHIDRPLEQWFERVRNFVITYDFALNQNMLTQAANDIVQNFYAITGVNINELSNFELEHLRHLIKFIAGMNDADKK